MSKTNIIIGLWLQGIIQGGILGAVSGSALGLCAFVTGILTGLPMGLIVGIFVGAVVGLSVGLITARYFYPLKNSQDYRQKITIICLVISPIVVALSVEPIWRGQLMPSGLSLLAAVVSLFTVRTFSKKLTTWYITQYKLFHKLESQQVL